MLFITGGASGAGFGQAKVFSEAGRRLVIADIRLDITDRQACAAADDEIEQHHGGPPDLVFNTAGFNTFGPAEASTFQDYDRVMGVYPGGVINGLVTLVPRMMRAGRLIVAQSFNGRCVSSSDFHACIPHCGIGLRGQCTPGRKLLASLRFACPAQYLPETVQSVSLQAYPTGAPTFGWPFRRGL